MARPRYAAWGCVVSGPQHYTDASALLSLAQTHRDTGNSRDHELAAQFAAEAQVHATLALAAATIDAARLAPTSRYNGFYPDEAWEEVLGQ